MFCVAFSGTVHDLVRAKETLARPTKASSSSSMYDHTEDIKATRGLQGEKRDKVLLFIFFPSDQV